MKLPTLRRSAPGEPAAPPAAPGDPADRSLEIALPAGVMARFVAALGSPRSLVGDAAGALLAPRAAVLSPDSVEGLLASAIGAAGGVGTARVVRSPAGLHSPEYWRIVVTGANGTAIDVVRRAARGEAPAA